MVVDDASEPRALAIRRFQARREIILSTYRIRLTEIDSAIGKDPTALKRTVDVADQMLAEMVVELRGAEPSRASRDLKLAEAVGAARATSGVHISDTLRASAILFDIVMVELAECLADTPSALNLLTVAARGLAGAMLGRIRSLTIAYSGLLLDAVHQENMKERARIARELHDRIGNSLQVAYRQLDLFEICQINDVSESAEMAFRARDSVRESIEKMRFVISGLRAPDADEGLEIILREYVNSVRANDIDVNVRVFGNEDWATPTVRGELFLIVREALHNAITHAAPRSVIAQIDISPYDIHGTVEDDGKGFDTAEVPRSSTGLASMRERTELLGGMTKIFGRPGKGTVVEFQIPLTGNS